MNSRASDKAPLIRRIERRNWWILGVILAVSAVLGPHRFTAGVALGGLINIAGFYSLQRVIRRILSLPAHRGRLGITLYHYARLGMLFAVLAWIIMQGTIHPLGLLLGLSVVVLSLLLTAVLDRRKIALEV